MAELPPAAQQILRAHAAFIHAVVGALHDPARRPQLAAMLEAAADQGWTRLAEAVRAIAAGRRDRAVLLGLDAEDRVIVEAILAGLADPAHLPPVQTAGDATAAAPGLAALIAAAARGEAQALAVLADMGEQMLRAGGDMARLAAILRRLVNGERDADRLTLGMGPLARTLVLDILDELARRDLH
ncbi:MAG: hypothetical protein NZ524_01240 [Thiobacillaceae bacterium]|nr:hypothetical protein [Thiobacillaceae bacterium]MCX7672352.1 hypothetical protein [Thiobacillaceae bacterium]MDW8322480.1 hypothetical protein [Burkholderiales bacterium]